MVLRHFEILVEEPSMEAALRAVLPKMIGEMSFKITQYTDKRTFLERLPNRLRGYARSLPSSHRIIVVIDRDNDDCHELKSWIETMARNAGLRISEDQRGPAQIIVRIAIEELEAWYFGDWEAVRAAYPKANKPPQHCRAPDAVQGGTWEAFERSMRKSGYFSSGLRKIEAATKIAPHIDPARNTSPSFQALRRAMTRV
ncbi:MAG: DUF4276 family protein [Acidibrevibacterium sp.]|uniref:DUF4276 family protein n=1 Tax=Acidibrevibacterium sp. TaxID=2606776 RepID=UPI003CFE525A